MKYGLAKNVEEKELRRACSLTKIPENIKRVWEYYLVPVDINLE